MIELIKYIVNQFAEEGSVEYIVEDTGDIVNVTIAVDENNIGRVIGRQGKIAKALRTIVRVAGAKEGKKYNIEIKEKGEI